MGRATSATKSLDSSVLVMLTNPRAIPLNGQGRTAGYSTQCGNQPTTAWHQPNCTSTNICAYRNLQNLTLLLSFPHNSTRSIREKAIKQQAKEKNHYCQDLKRNLHPAEQQVISQMNVKQECWLWLLNKLITPQLLHISMNPCHIPSFPLCPKI